MQVGSDCTGTVSGTIPARNNVTEQRRFGPVAKIFFAPEPEYAKHFFSVLSERVNLYDQL